MSLREDICNVFYLHWSQQNRVLLTVKSLNINIWKLKNVIHKSYKSGEVTDKELCARGADMILE